MGSRDQDDHSTFRLGTSRQVELSLRQELDDLTKKSLKAVNISKMKRKMEPLSNQQKNIHKMAPEFTPRRIRPKKKTEPVFHDELIRPKSSKDQGPELTSVPAYNALDRENSLVALQKEATEKSKKFPFCKDEIITTEEMRKPRQTSLGVLPLRNSLEIPGVHVLMEGKPAISVDDQERSIGAIEQANTAELDRISEITTPALSDLGDPFFGFHLHLKPKPPAILAGEGTIQSVQFTSRQKPPARPISHLKGKREFSAAARDAKSVASSYKSTAIHLPDEQLYSQYDEAIEGVSGPSSARKRHHSDERSQSSSVGSFKSAKELIEEAKQIATPGGEKHMKRLSAGKSLDAKKPRGQRKISVSKKEKPQTERTVDEIIAWLKDPNRQEVVSDADRKIQEIMNRVLSRHAPQEEEQEDEPMEEMVKAADADKFSDKFTDVADDGKTDDQSEVGTSTVTQPDGDDRTADMDTVGEKVDMDSVVMASAEGQKDNASLLLDGIVTGPTPEGQIDEDQVKEERISSAMERAVNVASSTDLTQAWKDMDVPLDVTYEDLVSIQASKSHLQARQPHPPSKVSPRKDKLPTVQATSVSFLSSWASVERPEVKKPERRAPRVEKSIHHFCTATTEVQLPDQFRGAWRKYHTPGKYHVEIERPQEEIDPSRIHSSASSGTGAGTELASHVNEQGHWDRVQSAAARKILEEANEIGQEDTYAVTLEEWKAKAEDVFDHPDLTLEGKSVNIRIDESRLYWTPAPPKMDMAPVSVKEHLFPKYHGAVLGMESEAPQIYEQSSEESDLEEEEVEEEMDPDDRQMRNRILNRNHHSARDLTALDWAIMEREEKTKQEPVSSEEASKLSKTESLNTVTTMESGGTQISSVRAQSAKSQAKDKTKKVDSVSESTSQKTEKPPLVSKVSVSDMRRNFSKVVVAEPSPEDEEQAPSSDPSADLPIFPKIRRTKSAPPDLDIDGMGLGEPQEFSSLMAEVQIQKAHLKKASEAAAMESSTEQGNTTTKLPTVEEKPMDELQSLYTPVAEPTPQPIEYKVKMRLKLQQEWMSTYTKMDDPDTQELVLNIIKPIEELFAETEGFLGANVRGLRPGSVLINLDLIFERDIEIDEQVQLIQSLQHQVETAQYRLGTLPVVADSIKLEDEPTPAELALHAGRAYVLLPKKSKKKQVVDMSRIEAVEKFLSSSPNKLERSESLPKVNMKVPRELRVPALVRSKNRGSLPDLLDFDSFAQKRGNTSKNAEDLREWTRDIWNDWFDEVFPPTPAESVWSEDEEQEVTSQQEEKPAKRKTSVASTVIPELVESIDPIRDTDENKELMEMLNEEVKKLNAQIDGAGKPRAFDLCRRGAVYRKLGRLKNSLEDLDAAILLEPQLIDAYWHRHLLHLLQNKQQAALEDLNIILKYNKNHAYAYKSRAEIFKKMGDITMSIINYGNALKLNPEDHESLYQRADMYEKRGETLLAMEDYSRATKLMPSKTDALYKHACHYFNNQQWESSVKDFNQLLKRDPNNAEARLYRGRAYSKLKQWNAAVTDFSAAIHLNPNNSKAFYYRACLLRKLYPKKAIQDLSVSLLIDDGWDNVEAYLHRGILYVEIGKHEDAIPDFESVLKLNKDIACAHVNLGLIYMTKMHNYGRAIKKFTSAIKVDPTYVRAYVCRGEAYTQLHDIKNALLDFTRAIHLRPDVHHYYMYRGQLVLQTGNLELAAFCVRHAAELNIGLGQSATQQAIVQTFLKNYDKAIDALVKATRFKPSASLFTLLGKTQMKAKLWRDAVDSFTRGLEVLKPWNPHDSMPIEAAEVHFLTGMCHVEQHDYSAAHESFNNAIKVNPKYAEAYYHRGLAKMRLRQSKGVQDFNRALALDPTIFQAYLSRAAYYGLKKQYKKGILNCNEAIKLQPNSVRAHLYRGALKYHIKAYTLAIRDLTQCTTIDCTCALAYFNRAVCYHDSGQYEKALQDYGIVLLLGDHLSLKVLINRGLLYFDKKDYNNALYDFLSASKVNPEDHQLHHTLGLCYHKLNKLQLAVHTFSQSVKVHPFFLDSYISRGNVYMDYGNKEGHTLARRDFERALHFDPKCLPARVNLAYNLQVAGRYQQAWHQFTAALAINPKYQPALEGRSIINLQMSDTFAAFQDINAAVSSKPTAELLTNRGVIHQFMGDTMNAMRDYKLALERDSTYALAYFNAANIYFYMRQFKQAKDYYDSALQYNEKDESAYLNRAITKALLKDAAAALEDFSRALKLSPHSAHMYYNRGNLYASLANFAKAEEDYMKALSLKPGDPLVYKRRADVRGKMGRSDEAIKDYKTAIELQSLSHKV